MAAVFDFHPSLRRTGRARRASPADRLPALLREFGKRRAGPATVPERTAEAGAESWRLLQSRIRRLMWWGTSLVVALDLFATFILRVR